VRRPQWEVAQVANLRKAAKAAGWKTCPTLMKHNRKMLFLALAGGWFGLICWASLSSHPPGVETMDSWLAWLPFPKVWKAGARLVVHLTLYGVWAVLCARALKAYRPALPWVYAAAITLGIVLAAGGAIEIAQRWIPNRAADLLDLSGNMVGAALFLVLARRLKTLQPRMNAD